MPKGSVIGASGVEDIFGLPLEIIQSAERNQGANKREMTFVRLK